MKILSLNPETFKLTKKGVLWEQTPDVYDDILPPSFLQRSILRISTYVQSKFLHVFNKTNITKIL
jgi:hypothetical protein